MNQNRRLSSLLCVCLAASVLLVPAGCGQSEASGEESSAAEEKAPISVELMNAETGTIQNEFIYSGKIRPKEESNIISTVAGKVSDVYFDVGDRVKAGDVLFQMETTDIENNLKVLEAQLAASNAQLHSAQTTLELVNGAAMQSQILSAKSGLAQAEIAFSDMQTTYDNNKQLFEAGIISKSDMDKTETGLKNAQIAYDQAKEAYDLVVNQMPAENKKKAQDAVTAAQASKNAVEAQMASVKKTLNDAAVTTPIAGVVTSKGVTPGSIYSSAAGAAFVINNLDQVYVEVGVSEQAINTIHPGDSVDVIVKTLSREPLTGTVDTVSPGASLQTGTYSVRVLLENPDGNLKSGMLGEVHFARDKKENVVLLPRDAVITRDEESYAFLAENGTAKRVTVEIGIDTGDQVEIISGISAGDSVIVKGQNFLEDGDPVSLADAPPAAGEE